MPAPTSSAERVLSILQSFVPSMSTMYCTGPWLSMLSGSVSGAERPSRLLSGKAAVRPMSPSSAT